MVNAINSVIASVLLLANPPQQPKQCLKNCQISEEGLSVIKTFEGYSPYIYKDVGGLDTIGFGHLITRKDKISQPLLGDEAEKLLHIDVKSTENGVNKLVDVKLWPNQFDALSSFTYNVGIGSLAKSKTMLPLVNAQKHEKVPAQFLRWVNVNGKPVRGLQVRRQVEAELYGNNSRE